MLFNTLGDVSSYSDVVCPKAYGLQNVSIKHFKIYINRDKPGVPILLAQSAIAKSRIHDKYIFFENYLSGLCH